MDKESRVQEDPCRELGSAHLAAREGQGALDLTVFPPKRVHRVMRAASECGERGCGLAVNGAVSPYPSHKLWRSWDSSQWPPAGQ